MANHTKIVLLKSYLTLFADIVISLIRKKLQENYVHIDSKRV